MEKLNISRAIVVEGLYDKTKLESVTDALILPVHGFSIFTDHDLQALIRRLAKTQGIVVLTDSDRAGFKIRGFLSSLVPADQLLHAYIPDIVGKERRKRHASKEGTLGVEGIPVELLRQALQASGAVSGAEEIHKEAITKVQMMELGLVGRPDSAEKRRRLYEYLGLPAKMGTNRVLAIINCLVSWQELVEVASTLEEEWNDLSIG